MNAKTYIFLPILYMSSLGGGIKGVSPGQTILGKKDSEDAMMRKVLRMGWNTSYATGTVNGRNRIITPFRAVNNSGDFLSRTSYTCGGPNQVNADKPGWKSRIGSIINSCDNSGIPSSTCNVKFVADSSDYIRFKKQTAVVKNYNDKSNGGDQSNASYVNIMAVRRR